MRSVPGITEVALGRQVRENGLDASRACRLEAFHGTASEPCLFCGAPRSSGLTRPPPALAPRPLQATEQRVVSQDIELWMTNMALEGGFSIVARMGKRVQELRVKTGMNRDEMKAVLRTISVRK